VARWEPNAAERLTEAAMALFEERGYARTTVGDIAARAGLTERTFFNHFSDKREVLFAGSEQFVARIVEAARAAPRSAAPLDVVVAAFEATNDFFEDRRPFSRRRSALIAAHPELQERELVKMLAVGAAITEVLEQRGASATTATLAAQLGGAIMRVGFEQWTRDARDRSLTFHLRAARRQLEGIVGARADRSTRERRSARAR
jgi:AcrR family transcriptional regulator